MTVSTSPAQPIHVEHRSGLCLSWDFWRDPFGAMDTLADAPELVFTRFMGWPMALVSTPELACEVLMGPPDLWVKDRLSKRATAIFGDGLLLADGAVWKRQRRMLNPGFRHARYASYAEVMLEEADAALDRWSHGGRIDLGAEMSEVTLKIAVRTLFGRGLDDAGVAAVGAAFTELSDFLAGALASSPVPLPRWLPLPSLQRYYRAVEDLEAVVASVVDARRGEVVSDEGPDDLLGMLLSVRDDDGTGLSDQVIRDQVMTFLLAGHETTALLLTSALHFLAVTPGERVRVEDEVDGALARGPLAFDTRLPFTDAVLKEALRLRPPAWAITREPVEDTVLGGHPVPAGTIVVVAPWQLHHDPRFWGADADVFRPDRFAGDAPKPPRGAYLPFGLGARKCIGMRFAELEARLLLARWAGEVRIEPESTAFPELQPSITARPAGPVWARVTRR